MTTNTLHLSEKGRFALEKNFNFTKAEIAMLEVFLKHGSQAEMAEVLFICVKTVKFHMWHIYRKVKAIGRTNLLKFLVANGFIDGVQIKYYQKEITLDRSSLPRGRAT